MTSKRRILLAILLGSSVAVISSGVIGAVQVPTGANIAAAVVIALTLLIEAPLAAMAIAKHEEKPHH